MCNLDFQRRLNDLNRIWLLALTHTKAVVEQYSLAVSYSDINVAVVGSKVPVCSIEANTMSENLKLSRLGVVLRCTEGGMDVIGSRYGLIAAIDRGQERRATCNILEEGLDGLEIVRWQSKIPFDVLDDGQ